MIVSGSCPPLLKGGARRAEDFFCVVFWDAPLPNPRLDFSHSRAGKVEGKEPSQKIFQSYFPFVDSFEKTENRYIRFYRTVLAYLYQ